MTKVENGEKATEGICMTCARELGMPVDNIMNDIIGKMGISREDFENMESEMGNMLAAMNGGSEEDADSEEGGAPAIDFPKLFRDAGIFGPTGGEENLPAKPEKKQDRREKKQEKEKKYKFLDTYCRNLTRMAAEGKLDRIVGRERELARVIQILCRRQKNNP
ncbi:MAG: ATP-dependent Clp protease ATP-binding subunit, partial [Clostridia bacterium]|nr:ATP-dependent Clp protease ATP-binding subunit [Clostridia bacterium]